jgi:hypothetical protein
MADLSELWPAIGNIMVDDTTLTGMLHSDASIYYADDLPVDLRPVLPAIRFWMVGETPNVNRTVLGDHEVRLEIDVFADSPKTNEAIRSRLDELLNVPLKRPQGIETDNYRVRGMWRTGSLPISLGRNAAGGGGPLYHLATEWTIRVALKG